MIEIIRKDFSVHSTIGILTIDGIFQCYTLEDVCRPSNVKIYGETAIPEGDYMLSVTPSTRFGRDMPLIYNNADLCVYGLSGKKWSGIRIHQGNSSADTDGCILVGTGKKTDWVSGSNDAFVALFDKITQKLTEVSPIPLKIRNEQV